jgi:hypothetical protein
MSGTRLKVDFKLMKYNEFAVPPASWDSLGHAGQRDGDLSRQSNF